MIFSWIYVFLNAISALLRQLGGQSISPAIILLMGSIASIVYFNLINLHKLKFIYKKVIQYYWHWIILNILIAIVWLSAIYAPSLIGAGLYTFLFFSFLSLLGAIFTQHNHKKINQLKWLSITGLILLILAVIRINLKVQFTWSELMGIILASLGGIFCFIYYKHSAHFYILSSLTASQILAVRFYLTVIICVLLLPHYSFTHLNQYHFIFAAMTAVFCLIVPLYFSQKGIESAGPEINAIICSAMPLITAILQNYFADKVSFTYFAIYCLYIMVIAIPVIAKISQNLAQNKLKKKSKQY